MCAFRPQLSCRRSGLASGSTALLTSSCFGCQNKRRMFAGSWRDARKFSPPVTAPDRCFWPVTGPVSTVPPVPGGTPARGGIGGVNGATAKMVVDPG